MCDMEKDDLTADEAIPLLMEMFEGVFRKLSGGGAPP